MSGETFDGSTFRFLPFLGFFPGFPGKNGASTSYTALGGQNLTFVLEKPENRCYARRGLLGLPKAGVEVCERSRKFRGKRLAGRINVHDRGIFESAHDGR